MKMKKDKAKEIESKFLTQTHKHTEFGFDKGDARINEINQNKRSEKRKQWPLATTKYEKVICQCPREIGEKQKYRKTPKPKFNFI